MPPRSAAPCAASTCGCRPVRLAGNGLHDLLTETQNVSARGVFFYLDRPLAEGARIEVTMTFPPHVTLTEPVRVRFTARVVRVGTRTPLRASVWPP